MALETEVKIRVSPGELAVVRRRLSEQGAVRVHDRSEEKNTLLDYPDFRLKNSGCALRVRSYGDQTILTFKGKIEEDWHFKKRPEFQTRVADQQAILEILGALGLAASFQYEKFREISRWEVSGQTVEICLDETPVGCFVEIEGSGEAIRQVAEVFGWPEDRFMRDSYVDLYRQAGGEAS